jgi:hypothetical protein
VRPDAPLPVPPWPKTFQSGTGPSSTRARFASGFSPSTHTAAKQVGSLKNSILCRTDISESAPVPSRQYMPAPMPPMGNATRVRVAPSYGPLNSRAQATAVSNETASIVFMLILF